MMTNMLNLWSHVPLVTAEKKTPVPLCLFHNPNYLYLNSAEAAYAFSFTYFHTTILQ